MHEYVNKINMFKYIHLILILHYYHLFKVLAKLRKVRNCRHIGSRQIGNRRYAPSPKGKVQRLAHGIVVPFNAHQALFKHVAT